MKTWMRKREWAYIVVAALLAAYVEARDAGIDVLITAEAADRAVARIESIPPEVLMHPLAGVPWIEQSYRRADGELVKVRRYTAAADLRERP